MHTGEVVTGEAADRQALVTGEAVNVAARLEQTAPPGEVLISDETRRLVTDAASVDPLSGLDLKGRRRSCLRSACSMSDPHVAGFTRRFDSPLVGRTRQLAQFAEAFEEATDMRVCHLFTVLGEPGAGKTRLVHEACATLSNDVTVAWGRCLS